MSGCYIIAEIGVNHGGDVALAIEMVDAAKGCGADAVKFQTFTADSLVDKTAQKVHYQTLSTPKQQTHYEMIRSLELSHDDHLVIYDHCKDSSIDFISTPYDIESAKFLVSMGVSTFKTASADIVDIPLHRYLASVDCNVIISTGMATLGEIEEVVGCYNLIRSKITLLHCVSNYPCSISSVNMRVMKTLQATFGLDVGYSDHSIGNEASILAVGLGASVIEKHFTTNSKLPGPDQKTSVEPSEFSTLVNSVRKAEVLLGDSHKAVQPEEMQMREISRKSLFLKRDIKQGQIILESDIECKRPGTGLYPRNIDYFTNKPASKDLMRGHKLKFDDISNE